MISKYEMNFYQNKFKQSEQTVYWIVVLIKTLNLLLCLIYDYHLSIKTATTKKKKTIEKQTDAKFSP